MSCPPFPLFSFPVFPAITRHESACGASPGSAAGLGWGSELDTGSCREWTAAVVLHRPGSGSAWTPAWRPARPPAAEKNRFHFSKPLLRSRLQHLFNSVWGSGELHLLFVPGDCILPALCGGQVLQVDLQKQNTRILLKLIRFYNNSRRRAERCSLQICSCRPCRSSEPSAHPQLCFPSPYWWENLLQAPPTTAGTGSRGKHEALQRKRSRFKACNAKDTQKISIKTCNRWTYQAYCYQMLLFYLIFMFLLNRRTNFRV